MSLNDKISSPTGIINQLTSLENFFKRILTENILIFNCTRGHIAKNIAIRTCATGYIAKNIAFRAYTIGQNLKNITVRVLENVENFTVFVLIN